MGMHTMDKLLLKWQQGDVTAEQMVGQLLQHMSVVYERLRLVERRVGSLAAAGEGVAPPPRKTKG